MRASISASYIFCEFIFITAARAIWISCIPRAPPCAPPCAPRCLRPETGGEKAVKWEKTLLTVRAAIPILYMIFLYIFYEYVLFCVVSAYRSQSHLDFLHPARATMHAAMRAAMPTPRDGRGKGGEVRGIVADVRRVHS
jgi:hypothetical protein